MTPRHPWQRGASAPQKGYPLCTPLFPQPASHLPRCGQEVAFCERSLLRKEPFAKVAFCGRGEGDGRNDSSGGDISWLIAPQAGSVPTVEGVHRGPRLPGPPPAHAAVYWPPASKVLGRVMNPLTATVPSAVNRAIFIVATPTLLVGPKPKPWLFPQVSISPRVLRAS